MEEKIKGTSKLQIIIRYIGALMSIMVLLNLLGITKLNLWSFESLLLIFVFTLEYIPKIAAAHEDIKKKVINGLLYVCSLIPCFYLFFNIERLEWYYGSVWTTGDIVMGTLMVLSIMIIVYRKYGVAMPVIACVLMAYTLFGHYLPKNMMWHRAISFSSMISYLFSPSAVFGTVFSTFCSVIVLYMLFGSFLDVSGVGKYMTDLAFSVAGKYRGGPAKVAIISSALLGSINGNSVANVVTTGTITIPLMKKVGYKNHFAGAVEAVASTGGQILPPVMGAGAFIMAELLQISFSTVAIAAAIPALLYYLAVFLMVDLEAVRLDLKGMAKADITPLKTVLKKFYLLLPIIILIFQLIVVRASITRSGIIAIVSCVIVSLFSKENRMTPSKIIDALYSGARDCIGIAGVCAMAGIIIGTVSMTGLGTRFSSMVLAIAGNNLYFLAFLTAVICIVLGMGLPTTAAYIICVTVAAPALIKLEIPALAAHMFVFYYAILAAITPPVAAASYAAASIADAPIMKTGWAAVKLGIAAYIIPFFFLNNQPLLFDGAPLEILIAAATSILGIALLSMVVQNITFFRNPFPVISRILYGVACIMLIDPNHITDLIGLGIIFVSFFLGKFFSTKDTTFGES